MTTLESIRNQDFVEFERDGKITLFHPETLCFFRVSRSAAGLIRDARQGAASDELVRKYGVGVGEIERSLTPIVKTIERQGRPLAQIDSGSSLKRNGILPKAVLMINNYCNLKCTYCYEHQSVFTKKAIDMPSPIARTTIDKIYAAFEGVDTWMFIGGEPTLSEDVLEFSCRYATEVAQRNGAIKPSFGMISNGVKMTGRLFDIVREFEIQVTFSLDGPKKVNDLVRIRHDNTGTFDAVVENVQRYREILPEKAQVECTVTQAHRDAGLSLTEVLDFCANRLGVDEPHIAAAGLPAQNPLNPYRSGNGMLKEFVAAAEASMDTLLNGGNGERKGGKLDVVSSMVHRLANRNPKPIMCPAGMTQIVVDSFGDIYPCWMFAGSEQHAMGNILRDEVRGPKALQVLDRVETNSKSRNAFCSTCYARSVCSACIGNNHNSTGRLEDPSPEFCDTVRGTLRVVVERLSAASASQTSAAVNGISGAMKC
jgi:uncharacterized protein